MNLNDLTNETLSKAADAVKSGALAKAVIDLSTGLTGQPMEAPAKLLVPLLSPFRQTIQRETFGGKVLMCKRITAVAPTGGYFVAEATKANTYAITKDELTFTCRSYGRGGDVTWESIIAGQNYEDVQARMRTLLLLQNLKEEELIIFGGNRTALAQPTGLTVTAGTSGGSLADATYKVRVFALTLEAIARASRIARPTSGNSYDCTTVPTADTSVGFSVASAEGSGTVSGGSGAGKLTLSWTAVAGACGYAIYISTTTGAGNQKLQAIVSQSKAVITATNTTGAADPTGGDTSADTKAFDGIIAQLFASGSGAYLKNVAGPLSAAVGNQIPEIAAMLNDIYDRTKTEPDRLLMNWQEQDSISQKLISVANDRVVIPVAMQGETPVFPMVEWIKSPRGKRIPIESNPNLPGGMILAVIDSVPYTDSEIPAAWKMWMGSDFVELDYAMTAPKKEVEQRAYGTLAGYAPALQGVLYNIWAF